VPITVTGSSGPPTGTVTLTSGSYNSGAQTLVGGSFTFIIPPDSLAIGTDTLTVTYSGDSTYASSTGSGQITVNGLNAIVTANPSSASINSNQTVTISGTVSGGTGNPIPTGTVTLTGG